MKNKLKSKTLWANGLTTAAGVLALLQGEVWIMENPTASGIILTAVGLMNIWLRFKTNTGLK